jgi:group I intron endonuclease
MFVNTANGKKYIGQTWNYKRRVREHLNGHGYAKLLSYAIKKYGPSGFTRAVLVSNIQTQEELDYEEIEAIGKYNTLCPGGYNIREGGLGGQHSEATKLLIGNGHRGKDVSKETRMKLSLRNIGKTMSEDTRSRVSEGLLEYHRDLDKPIYFFDAYTHERVRMFKNMTELRSQTSFPPKRVINSICHEWAFKYEQKRCYARYVDRPLEKNFQVGRRQVMVTFLNATQEQRMFYSTQDATRTLNVGRGVIDSLIRKRYDKSKCVYKNKTVSFTASYYLPQIS